MSNQPLCPETVLMNATLRPLGVSILLLVAACGLPEPTYAQSDQAGCKVDQSGDQKIWSCSGGLTIMGEGRSLRTRRLWSRRQRWPGSPLGQNTPTRPHCGQWARRWGDHPPSDQRRARHQNGQSTLAAARHQLVRESCSDLAKVSMSTKATLTSRSRNGALHELRPWWRGSVR